MTGASILLGEVTARAQVPAVACGRCDPFGRLHVARLVAEHGADMLNAGLLRFLTQGLEVLLGVAEQ